MIASLNAERAQRASDLVGASGQLAVAATDVREHDAVAIGMANCPSIEQIAKCADL